MNDSNKRRRPLRALLLALGISAIACATGCQVDIGGQTLPSPYYMSDDVQYFPTGPEFKLAGEAAAMGVQTAEEALQR